MSGNNMVYPVTFCTHVLVLLNDITQHTEIILSISPHINYVAHIPNEWNYVLLLLNDITRHTEITLSITPSYPLYRSYPQYHSRRTEIKLSEYSANRE